MTQRCLLREKRVLQPCTRLQLVLCFWDHLLAVILDQKSPAAVRRLPPHRGRRSVEASLVELTLTQDTFVSRDEFFFVMPQTPSGVDKKQKTV